MYIFHKSTLPLRFFMTPGLFGGSVSAYRGNFRQRTVIADEVLFSLGSIIVARTPPKGLRPFGIPMTPKGLDQEEPETALSALAGRGPGLHPITPWLSKRCSGILPFAFQPHVETNCTLFRKTGIFLPRLAPWPAHCPVFWAQAQRLILIVRHALVCTTHQTLWR